MQFVAVLPGHRGQAALELHVWGEFVGQHGRAEGEVAGLHGLREHLHDGLVDAHGEGAEIYCLIIRVGTGRHEDAGAGYGVHTRFGFECGQRALDSAQAGVEQPGQGAHRGQAGAFGPDIAIDLADDPVVHVLPAVAAGGCG